MFFGLFSISNPNVGNKTCFLVNILLIGNHFFLLIFLPIGKKIIKYIFKTISSMAKKLQNDLQAGIVMQWLH